MDIFQLLDTTIERKASDLHLVVGFYPAIRVNSELIQLRTLQLIAAQSMKDMIMSVLSEELKENLLANKEIDFGYEHKGHRFRVNVYYSKGDIAASFRLIGNQIQTLEELNLPLSLRKLTDINQGLVLITGPTGEGKSTTLASLINEINNKYARHIITIEDPIEYVYPNAKSVISQRELHQDTHSWNVALRSILREDPDVVLIGEMRDYETIQSAITIAETGHLVFSTLHTGSATQTIDRIIDVFPANQQNQIRIQLAAVLRAVVAQRLVPNVARTKRFPAVELLYNIPAVAAVIREGRTQLLDNILETGEDEGLFLFEKYLARMFNESIISKDMAYAYALRPTEIKKFVM